MADIAPAVLFIESKKNGETLSEFPKWLRASMKFGVDIFNAIISSKFICLKNTVLFSEIAGKQISN